MRNAPTIALLFATLGGGVSAEESGEVLPPLAAKAYEIGVAPSHVAAPPASLFDAPDQWRTVASQVSLFKYYGVQFLDTDWATQLEPEKLVAFAASKEMRVGCEFGDFSPRRRGAKDLAATAFRQLDPVVEAEGRISSIHLDGPIRRMIQGVQDQPHALSLDQIAERLVGFWGELGSRYPDLRIGLVVNLPNWDYTRDFSGYNGHFTDRSGLTYAEALDAVHGSLSEAGMKMDFLEIDCPYQYYRETRTRKGDAAVNNAGKFAAIQRWCQERDIKLHLVLNAEPRNGGARLFHELTCEYVRHLRRDGIFPDVFVVQSWYREPEQNLPEDTPFTFMHTTREAIALIRDLYPNAVNQEERSQIQDHE